MKMPDKERVRRELRRIETGQGDIGLTRIILRDLFEPPNIFDPGARRRLKPELLFVLIYGLLVAAVWAAFNLR